MPSRHSKRDMWREARLLPVYTFPFDHHRSHVATIIWIIPGIIVTGHRWLVGVCRWIRTKAIEPCAGTEISLDKSRACSCKPLILYIYFVFTRWSTSKDTFFSIDYNILLTWSQYNMHITYATKQVSRIFMTTAKITTNLMPFIYKLIRHICRMIYP